MVFSRIICLIITLMTLGPVFVVYVYMFIEYSADEHIYDIVGGEDVEPTSANNCIEIMVSCQLPFLHYFSLSYIISNAISFVET